MVGRCPLPAAMACFVGVRWMGPWEEQVWTLSGSLAGRSDRQETQRGNFCYLSASISSGVGGRVQRLALEIFLEEPATPQPSASCQPTSLWEQMSLDLFVLKFSVCLVFDFLAVPLEQWSPTLRYMQDNSLGCGKSFSSTCVNSNCTCVGSACSRLFTNELNGQNILETTALEESSLKATSCIINCSSTMLWGDTLLPGADSCWCITAE